MSFSLEATKTATTSAAIPVTVPCIQLSTLEALNEQRLGRSDALAELYRSKQFPFRLSPRKKRMMALFSRLPRERGSVSLPLSPGPSHSVRLPSKSPKRGGGFLFETRPLTKTSGWKLPRLTRPPL